jgi:hypothetical protein
MDFPDPTLNPLGVDAGPGNQTYLYGGDFTYNGKLPLTVPMSIGSPNIRTVIGKTRLSYRSVRAPGVDLERQGRKTIIDSDIYSLPTGRRCLERGGFLVPEIFKRGLGC